MPMSEPQYLHKIGSYAGAKREGDRSVCAEEENPTNVDQGIKARFVCI